MSELTRCNYCTLLQMRKRAKARGVTVILDRDAGWITARYSDKKKPSTMFLTLTKYCVC
jgi:hypothetical protein